MWESEVPLLRTGDDGEDSVCPALKTHCCSVTAVQVYKTSNTKRRLNLYTGVRLKEKEMKQLLDDILEPFQKLFSLYLHEAAEELVTKHQLNSRDVDVLLAIFQHQLQPFFTMDQHRTRVHLLEQEDYIIDPWRSLIRNASSGVIKQVLQREFRGSRISDEALQCLQYAVPLHDVLYRQDRNREDDRLEDYLFSFTEKMHLIMTNFDAIWRFLKSLQEFDTSDWCNNAMHEMDFCSACYMWGEEEPIAPHKLFPCSNYCSSVVYRCLAPLRSVQQTWITYVKQFVRLVYYTLWYESKDTRRPVDLRAHSKPALLLGIRELLVRGIPRVMQHRREYFDNHSEHTLKQISTFCLKTHSPSDKIPALTPPPNTLYQQLSNLSKTERKEMIRNLEERHHSLLTKLIYQGEELLSYDNLLYRHISSYCNGNSFENDTPKNTPWRCWNGRNMSGIDIPSGNLEITTEKVQVEHTNAKWLTESLEKMASTLKKENYSFISSSMIQSIVGKYVISTTLSPVTSSKASAVALAQSDSKSSLSSSSSSSNDSPNRLPPSQCGIISTFILLTIYSLLR